MNFVIENGVGNATKAFVDDNHRLHTRSVAEPSQGEAAITGNSYNLNTGSITLTTANESALAYIKNNGERPIHIESVGYLIGNSTGGVGDLLVTLLRNPSSGSIITNATPLDVNINKNFSSQKSLTVDAYKGVEGATFTSGEQAYFSLLPRSGNPYLINTGKIVLGKGASIGVKIRPQVGNTLMDMQVFFAVTDYDL